MPTFVFDPGVDAFIEANGSHPVADGAGWLLLPSGAVVSEDRRTLHPPPTDPVMRLLRRKEYLYARLDRTRADREAVLPALRGEVNRLTWPAGRYPEHNPRTPRQALEVLDELIAADLSALAELRAELDAAPGLMRAGA
jgi:hypothetical protein